MVGTSASPASTKINVTECDKTINCFRFPPSCSSLKDCRAIAAFTYNKTNDIVSMKLATKKDYGYVAFAQHVRHDSNTDTMVKIRGQVCGRAVPQPYFATFHGNNLRSNRAPTWITADVEGVDFIEGHVDPDDVLLCSYERKVVPPTASADLMYDMNQKLYAILAYGSMGSSKPRYHSQYFVSSAKLDFLKQLGPISTAERSVKTQEWVHGLLMMLGFLALAPLGIFTSRYKVLFGEVWFKRHFIVMVTTMLLIVIAFVIILVHTHGWPEVADKHHYAGGIAVIVFLVQPLMALLRPEPTHPRRWIFTWAHRFVGAVGWLLGAIAATFAMQMFQLDISLMVVFIVVIVLSFVGVDVYLALQRKKESDTSDSVQAKEGGDEVECSTTQPTAVSTSGRGGMLGYVVMGFGFLFAVIVIIVYLVILNKGGGHSHGGHSH